MKILILSHFDKLMGPQIYLKAPKSFDNEKLLKISNLIDVEQESGFFIHYFDDIKTANLIFEVPSALARGRTETCMISIAMIDEEPKSEILKQILMNFSEEFKKLKGIDAFLNDKNKKQTEDTPTNRQIKEFFYKFHRSLPKETKFNQERNSSIFIFGLDNAGKTTIISRLKQNIFTNPVPTTNINIIRLLFENLSITAYDAAGQKVYRKIWEPYLKNQDALVFIVDVTDEKRHEEAQKELIRITNYKALKEIPLLVLFNKIDLKKVKLKNLVKTFDIKSIKDRPKKAYLTSAKLNYGIIESFEWLAGAIFNRLLLKPT